MFGHTQESGSLTPEGAAFLFAPALLLKSGRLSSQSQHVAFANAARRVWHRSTLCLQTLLQAIFNTANVKSL